MVASAGTNVEGLHSDLTGKLIETFRWLNLNIRSIDEATLASTKSGSTSIREIIYRKRSNELKFAQALKERLTGVPPADVAGDHEETPVVGTESENDPTSILLSQFGSARATTLNFLRGMEEAQWTEQPDGEPSILKLVEDLIVNDEEVMKTISEALGPKA